MPTVVNGIVYDNSISLSRVFVFELWNGFDLVPCLTILRKVVEFLDFGETGQPESRTTTHCWKSAIWLWSFVCCVYTSILICHCMHVSIRLDRLVDIVGGFATLQVLGPHILLEGTPKDYMKH